MNPRKRSSMQRLSDRAKIKTDKALEDSELELLRQTSIPWSELRPQVTDKETFDKLRAAVEESTKNNEKIDQIKKRLSSLGKEGLRVARRVIDLANLR